MKGAQFMYEVFEQLLQKKGVTPYKVAKEAGVTQTALSNWKSGRSTPTTKTLQKIADYFGVTIDYLMTGNEDGLLKENFLTSKDERDISKTVNDLMQKLESNDGAPLFFDGAEMNEETKILFEQQLKSLVTTVKEINKIKFNPNKNKK